MVLSCSQVDDAGLEQPVSPKRLATVELRLTEYLKTDETIPTIRTQVIRGPIHQERRLHSLLF